MAQVTPEQTSLIVVVAKAPRPGAVKTRLCPPLTPVQAAAFYTGFLLDTVEIALAVPGSAVRAVCPTAEDARALQELLPPAVGYIIQAEPGLTAALTGSFEQGLALGYSKVMCISSDNPTLPAEYLAQAVTLLDRLDVVLGPSEDGGYYLIGAKAVYPQLFEGMEWSNERVLGETEARLERSGLRHARLPLWYDLDTGPDLNRFIRGLADTPLQRGRYTRQVLAELSETERQALID